MGFRLIVFDWDGTLMDSEARIVTSIRAAFADMGERPPSREAARDVIGESPCSGCETGHPSPPFALRSGDYW